MVNLAEFTNQRGFVHQTFWLLTDIPLGQFLAATYMMKYGKTWMKYFNSENCKQETSLGRED